MDRLVKEDLSVREAAGVFADSKSSRRRSMT